MSKRTYYMLCERLPGKLWTPEFGDFNKQVVIQERKDMKESGSFVKGTEFKIITNNGTAKAITEAVDQLNQEALNKALRVADEKKLSEDQLVLMSAILGISNCGSDHLFEGHHVTWTPDRVKQNYANRRVKRALRVGDVTADLCGSLCENDEMLENFIEEATSWVPRLNAMTIEQIKSTWPRYAAFVDCVE